MNKTRVAIVGVALRSSYWMMTALLKRDDVEIVALCDLVGARAEWAKTKHNLDKVAVFTSVRKMLRKVECDAVMVATSDAHHAEVAIPALKQGKFVYCEKPLDISRTHCRALIAADDAAGGKTMVGHNLRYAPVYATVKRLVDSGTIGKILTIQTDEFYDQGRTYFRRWNRLRKEGGGLWITKASHDFDMLAWLVGAKPIEIQAMAARTYYVPKTEAAKQCRFCALQPTCPDRARTPVPIDRIREENGGAPYDLCLFNNDSDTFDHGIAQVLFEGDIFATYTCNMVTGVTDRRIRISGTKGTLDGSLRAKTLMLVKRDPSETVEVPVGGDVSDMHGGGDRMILDEFFNFVRGKGQPSCRPRDAALAVSMGLAATHASDTHKTVAIKRFAIV